VLHCLRAPSASGTLGLSMLPRTRLRPARRGGAARQAVEQQAVNLGAAWTQAVVRSIQAFLSAGAPRVRALGGARFDPAAAPAAEWAPFGSFCLLLPRLELLEAATCSLLACTLAWRPKPEMHPQHVAPQPAAGRAGWGAAGEGSAPGANCAASGEAWAGGGVGGGAAGAGPATLAEAAAAALAALAAAQAPAPPSAPSLQVHRPPPPHGLPLPGPWRLSRAPCLRSLPCLTPCACACMHLLHSPLVPP